MRRILHLQRDCIGCDSCVDIAPGYWRMNDEGLAELLQPVGERGPYVLGEGFDEDGEILEDAAAACPVQIIHLER